MAGMRAGFAKIVITPPVGVRLAGYSGRVKPSVGVLDELYAKAMVLEEHGRRIALVVCDLLELNAAMTAAIRARVRELGGIDPERVMIAATHTHCGPDLDLLEDATIDHLVSQVSGAVRAAAADLREMQIGWGAGRCGAGINRRSPRSFYAPYFLYSHPGGAMDETLLVTAFRDPGGSMRAALFNYACHAVTLGNGELHISKDWVEDACDTLNKAWGATAVPMFLQGCAGNVNPNWIYDDPSRDPPPERVFPEDLAVRLRESRRIGRLVGGTALAAAESIMSYRDEATLGSATRVVELPVRTDLPKGLREHLERLAGARGSPRRKYPGVELALAQGTRTVSTEVQVFRIGEGLVVGLPGEVFVEWQIELRRRLAPRPVCVVELANDAINYIPTPEAFREGGYEPLVSWFAPEAGEILVHKALEAAGEFD